MPATPIRATRCHTVVGAIAAAGMLIAAVSGPAHAAPAPAGAAAFDPTFGAGGVVTPRAGSSTRIAVQPDRKILAVGGDYEANPDGDARITRYNVDGSIDVAFGTGGTTHLDIANYDDLNGVAVGPDGRIVVVGSSTPVPDLPARSDAFVARFDADGGIDPSFGDGGKVVMGNGGIISFAAVAVQPDNKVLVGGAYVRNMDDVVLVHRYNEDGSVDDGFGGPSPDPEARVLHQAIFSCEVLALRVMSGGTVLAAGGCRGGGMFGASLQSDGHLDRSYGSEGATFATYGTPGGGHADGATILTDGSVAFAGSMGTRSFSDTDHEFSLFRFTADGHVDFTFGLGGVVSSPVSGAPFALATSVAEGPDGSLTAFGMAIDRPDSLSFPGRLFVAHLSASGAFDQGFGSGGISAFAVANESRYRSGGVVVQADGRPVLTGSFYDPAISRTRSVLLRLQGATAAARVRASGWNIFGQIGDSTTATACRMVPTVNLKGSYALSAGAFHNLALDGGGNVSAWGYNGMGELGDGTVVSRTTPVGVNGLSDVVAVAAGAYHSLAVRRDGSVWAWGWNAMGQLGDRTTADRHVPVRVAGLTGVVAVAAGAYHSVALRSDGSVWTWGWNWFGQLGDGTAVTRLSPVAVVGAPSASSVAAGAFHTLAVDRGQVRAWGFNGFGQLGDDTTVDRRVPVTAIGVSGATSVAGGAYHSLAVRNDGSVRAWGWNALGQLGDGTVVDRHSAVAALGAGSVTSVAAGYFHNVALGIDGSVQSWGWNALCQLGDGSLVDRSRPVVVMRAGSALAVSAGGFHSVIDGQVPSAP